MKPSISQQTQAAKVVAAPSPGSVLPAPCYPCKYCGDEYSWPADDLYWSAAAKGWICTNCWEYEDHGDHGIRLDKEMQKRTAIITGDMVADAVGENLPFDCDRIAERLNHALNNQAEPRP